MKRVGTLHVLTDTVLQSAYSHEELARLALEGGADVIQFRQKEGATRELIEVARRLKRLCEAAGALLIVNDRVDVALAADADGVHLGREDFPIPLARTLLGEGRLVGGSAATLAEARRCVDEGADYVGFGPVFPTGSKADAGPVSGLEGLRRVARAVPVPVIAIGGVDATNAPEVLGAGARGIAVISAVCCQADPREAARRLRRLLAAREEGGARG
ncbi:MAG: thiamine phosphate synthase [Deferrisomatales bacterium]